MEELSLLDAFAWVAARYRVLGLHLGDEFHQSAALGPPELVEAGVVDDPVEPGGRVRLATEAGA